MTETKKMRLNKFTCFLKMQITNDFDVILENAIILKFFRLKMDILNRFLKKIFKHIQGRVSQIAGVFQKMFFESCTLLHIIPLLK